MRSLNAALFVVIVLTTVFTVTADAQLAPLTDQEQAGRQIYLHGTSPSGHEILARMGASGLGVPAATLPCGGCHGADGRGRPEGGLAPSDLRWDALTKPYGVQRPSGREHPPYTEPQLKRSITMGIDAGGNTLHDAMPRYALSRPDMDALLAYLKRLGNEPHPGVGERTLRLGTVLPPRGQLDALGQAIQAVLEAGLSEINQQGGIFGRRLELHVHQLPSNSEAWASGVIDFVRQDEIFALVGAYISGQDEAIRQALDRQAVPLIGPFTSDPNNRFPMPRSVFYLLPGPTEQARALLKTLRESERPQTSFALLYTAADPAMRQAAESLVDTAPESFRAAAFETVDIERIVGEWARNGVEDLLFLGSSRHLDQILAMASSHSWMPNLHTTAHLTAAIAEAASRGFEGRTTLAFPTLPRDLSPPGQAEYQQLRETYGLPKHHRMTQISTLGATKLLIEGLRHVGRDLTRDRLVSTLEGFRKVVTGVMPPLSYDANRRIGAGGVWVAHFDPALGRLEQARWLELD